MTGRVEVTRDDDADDADDIGLSDATATVRDSGVVAIWTLVSRLSGVARVAVVAAVLGPTFFGNTFQATNSLPNTIYYGLLAGSLLSSLLVPCLVKYVDRRAWADCERVVGGVLGLLLFGLAILAAIAVPAVPLALQLGSSSSASPDAGDAQQAAARLFVLLVLPQVFLYAVIGCSAAVMHARRRFALPAGAPVLENVGIIATVALAALLFRGDTGASQHRSEILWLGLGSTAAVGLHAAVQWWGAARSGVRLRPRAGWRDPEIVGLLRSSAPMFAQAAAGASQVLLVLFAVNQVAGGVVAYQMAANFYYLPIALAATPVALSLLPRLARLHRLGADDAFAEALLQGLRFALFMTVPAAAAMVALAQPLARSMSYGAMAVDRGDTLVSTAVVVLAVGVVGETAFIIATYASYARGDVLGPLKSTAWRVGTSMLVLTACLVVDGTAVIVLAAASVSAGALVAAVHRTHGLLRTLSLPPQRVAASTLRLGAGAVVMSLVLYLLERQLPDVYGLRALLLTSALVAVGGAVFVAVEAALRAPEVTWLRQAASQRSRGPSGRGRQLAKPAAAGADASTTAARHDGH